MALGETQIVQETRQFLLDNSVSLDSFSQVVGRTFVSAPFISIYELRSCRFSTGSSSEEYNCDPGQKPPSWSDGVGA